MIVDRQVRILLRKEWRQLTANRAAVLTSLLLPFFMLLVLPVFTMYATSAAPPEKMSNGPTFGMFAEVAEDPTRLPIAMLPMMVSFVAVILPTMLTTYLVISERESRTLELLVALPISIAQLLRAKLLIVVLASAGATVPLLAVDAVVALSLGLASVSDVIALPFLLVAVLGFATAGALLIALLARDFRTANSVAGFIMVPAVLGTMVGTMLLPSGWVRPTVLGICFAIAGLGVARIALRVVTFERLMS